MNAKDFLKQLKIVVVAVVDDSKPWAVPVAVQRYHDGKVEWISKTNTVHSQAIAANGQVALTAFQTKNDDGGEYGFYARATARKKLPIPGGFGLYEATITDAWYNDAKHLKTNIDITEL